MALITNTTDGNNPVPGGYTVDIGGANVGITSKYTAGASSTLFPGLLAGRARSSTSFTQLTSLNNVTAATSDDVVGLVAMPRFGASDSNSTSLAYDDLITNATYFPEGNRLEVIVDQPGSANIFAGAAIAAGDLLAVAATTTGTGATTVVAGSLVPSTFAAGPVLELAGLVTLNPTADGATYTRGDLVPVSIAIISR
mgnify:CR=1 FL=1